MSKESALNALTSAPAPEAVSNSPGLQPAEAPATAAVPLESSRIAHIAKKEQELVRQRDLFKKQQESIQSERQKMQEIQTQLNSFNETKMKDPVAALKMIGFSETDLFNFLAQAEDKSTPEEKATKAAQAEINKFKDEQTKKERELEEKRNSEVLTNFRAEITKAIAADPDKFEYCKFNGPLAEELIYDTVAAVLEDSGEVITVDEAAQMVEEYYENADQAMSVLKKRQPKPQPEEAAPTATGRPASKTLSSRTGASIASTTTTKYETMAQKKARLVQKLGSFGKE